MYMEECVDVIEARNYTVFILSINYTIICGIAYE